MSRIIKSTGILDIEEKRISNKETILTLTGIMGSIITEDGYEIYLDTSDIREIEVIFQHEKPASGSYSFGAYFASKDEKNLNTGFSVGIYNMFFENGDNWVDIITPSPNNLQTDYAFIKKIEDIKSDVLYLGFYPLNVEQPETAKFTIKLILKKY